MQCLAELPIGSIGQMVRIFDNNLEHVEIKSNSIMYKLVFILIT